MLLLFLTLDEMNTTISVVNFFATAMSPTVTMSSATSDPRTLLFFPRRAIFKGKLQLTFGAMVHNCSRDLRPLYSLFCSLLCGAFGCFLSACKPKTFLTSCFLVLFNDFISHHPAKTVIMFTTMLCFLVLFLDLTLKHCPQKKHQKSTS